MALSDRVVVMERGSIQQIGAPEEIYRFPTKRTVAAFFGTPNLLDAEVEGCERLNGKRVRLNVVGKGWRGSCEAADEARPGEIVTVMVRPEDARIVLPDSGAGEQELKWSGRIAHTTYRGATRSVVVQTENGRLTIDASASCNYSIGDNVNVIAHQHAAWAITKDETLR
jgi:iron(III) transport system ATP-binding protein